MNFLAKLLSPVIYTDTLPDKFDGYHVGPIALIRPKFRDDAGLLAHERFHAWQWYLMGSCVVALLLVYLSYRHPDLVWYSLVGMVAHNVLYTFLKPYRYWAEVAAYKAQAKHYPDDRRKLFARFIQDKYNLRVDYIRVLRDLGVEWDG